MLHDRDIDRLRQADPATGLPEEALALSRALLVPAPASTTTRRPSRRLLIVGGAVSAFALAAAAAIPALVSTTFGTVEHVQTVDDGSGRCSISAMLLQAGVDDGPAPAGEGTPARPGSVQGPTSEDEEGGAQMTIAAAYSTAGDAPSSAGEDDFATAAEWFDAQDFDPVLRAALDAAGDGTSWEDGDAAVASALQDIESRLAAAGVDPHGAGVVGVEIVCDVDAG